MEFLADLTGIGTGGVPGGWRYLSGQITADGHSVPRYIGQVAARSGGVGANEAVVHTLDLDDCTGQAGGRIVRVHLADAAISCDDRRIHEGDDHLGAIITGKNNVLGASVVDLITLRGFQLCDGIGACFQRADNHRTVPPSNYFFGVGSIIGLDKELCASQTLIGIGCIHLFNSQVILFTGDCKPANQDGLYIIGRMMGGTGACVMVLIDITFAPDTLLTKAENVQCTISEGPALQLIIDAFEVCPIDVVVDIHEFFSTCCRRVREQAFLIAPDNSLHPGVHHPNIIRAPCLSDTEGNGLIRKHPGGVAIEVGHHVLHSRIADGLRLIPLMAFQRPAHPFALFRAKTHDAIAVIVISHLVHITDTQRRRLIVGAVVGTIGQLDCTWGRFSSECCGWKQAKHTEQGQQHRKKSAAKFGHAFHVSSAP